jgi:hypothetical protein
MEKWNLLPDDPFYVSGTNRNDRELLKHLMGNRGHHIKYKITVPGPWDTETSDNRLENYRRSWLRGFQERIGAAVLSGAFLIAPMWLMVLHNTLYTGLVSTTAFVAFFGLLASSYLKTAMEVMSVTAAYTAVLVVFVGLTTEGVGKESGSA